MLHLGEAINYFSFITRRVVLILQLALVLLHLHLNSATGNFSRILENIFPILGSRNAANIGYQGVLWTCYCMWVLCPRGWSEAYLTASGSQSR